MMNKKDKAEQAYLKMKEQQEQIQREKERKDALKAEEMKRIQLEEDEKKAREEQAEKESQAYRKKAQEEQRALDIKEKTILEPLYEKLVEAEREALEKAIKLEEAIKDLTNANAANLKERNMPASYDGLSYAMSYYSHYLRQFKAETQVRIQGDQKEHDNMLVALYSAGKIK